MSMIAKPQTELHYVNSQFVAAWKSLARRSRDGEFVDLQGVVMAWSCRMWPILNAAIFSTPVLNTEDFQNRIESAMGYASGKEQVLTVIICQEWLPKEVRRQTKQILSGYSLYAAFSLKGMIANRLLPSNVLPTRIEFRKVKDQQTRQAVADLNTISYGLPVEWGREALDDVKMWDGGVIGYVGYLNDKPVTCASAYLLDDCLYLALVATHPTHRRKGYAEAAIRHTLQQASVISGWRRSVLHSTPNGYSLYRKLGYRGVGTLAAYRRFDPLRLHW